MNDKKEFAKPTEFNNQEEIYLSLIDKNKITDGNIVVYLEDGKLVSYYPTSPKDKMPNFDRPEIWYIDNGVEYDA